MVFRFARIVAAATIAAASMIADWAQATASTPMATFWLGLVVISSGVVTAASSSPSSIVEGKAFDRMIQIWLENTNYNIADADPDMQWLAEQGILLTNYWAVTHPSQPNYAAAVAGDHFGMESDDFLSLPANISTVVDLLDTKGITWGEYQEDMPFAGFQGSHYSDQKTFRNAYVRKHNPLILFDNVVSNTTRLSLIKNTTSWAQDIANQALPQWSFVTPNMQNDGHDTNITFAAAWVRAAIEPLLFNSYFMSKTRIIISFDENEMYSTPNSLSCIYSSAASEWTLISAGVYTVLLGGAVDPSLKGTSDSTFYNHYSTLSSVSVNWDLPSLGRWDCAANVFALVANKTGYQNAFVDTSTLNFNASYPGPLSNKKFTPGWWAAPDTTARCANGRGVLASIINTWAASARSYNYTNVYPYDGPSGTDSGGTTTIGSKDSGNRSTADPSSSTAGTVKVILPLGIYLGIAGLVTALI